MATVSWMSIQVKCNACQKQSQVVLGTKEKSDKPLAKCPLCKSDQIAILSVTPKTGEK
jgi:hypothetical protein